MMNNSKTYIFKDATSNSGNPEQIRDFLKSLKKRLNSNVKPITVESRLNIRHLGKSIVQRIAPSDLPAKPAELKGNKADFIIIDDFLSVK